MNNYKERSGSGLGQGREGHQLFPFLSFPSLPLNLARKKKIPNNENIWEGTNKINLECKGRSG